MTFMCISIQVILIITCITYIINIHITLKSILTYKITHKRVEEKKLECPNLVLVRYS